ncbi:hypothetical protein Ahy_B01g056440 [Arachis hypogaea]|uniref:SWIM-type domain-containing protein n=1 Tax=Arachis hypogaea TaxID=3818 RepID=A0A445AYW1_ARAHY|nr:hypothetical protein Ahy_B01g056440 [Arachis hypogaea]
MNGEPVQMNRPTESTFQQIFRDTKRNWEPRCKKESRNWHAIRAKDTGYEKFEVHGRLTNHVIDLEKRRCTCRFWILTSYISQPSSSRISCVHACTTLVRVNKYPEDFCHKLITIKSYKETYKYHNNPIPGQLFWE